jgi:TfoX/Sxy family transcriptional regulator of competence genes
MTRQVDEWQRRHPPHGPGLEEIDMASDPDFVDFIVDQMGEAGSISQRKMFGEYALYCDGKIVALVCDNQLFVKPTAGGRAYIGTVVEAPPYPGAKPYFLIEGAFEERDWISALIKITAQELPPPKPKRSKTKASQ